MSILNVDGNSLISSLAKKASMEAYANGMRKDLQSAAGNGVVTLNATPYTNYQSVIGSDASQYSPTFIQEIQSGLPWWASWAVAGGLLSLLLIKE